MRRSGERQPEWWKSGLDFTCLPDCGRCCDEPGGIVYLHLDDAVRLADHFEMDVDEWLARDCRRTLDGRFILNSREEDDICIYLDQAKMCKVYESKPTQCSAFPWWSENLRSERTWLKTKQTCPGIDHEEAIRIEGDEISFWVDADRTAAKGFRNWPARR